MSSTIAKADLPRADAVSPFDFKKWIDEHRHLLKPPVNAKMIFEESDKFIIMALGGPNLRTDYHDDPRAEFFYQIQGDIYLRVMEPDGPRDIPIKEGEIYVLPPHVRHSPQRSEGTVGLVMEIKRDPGEVDGFEWYCLNCGDLVHRIEIEVTNIPRDLPPLFEQFYASEQMRTCKSCGTVHPGQVARPSKEAAE